MRPDLADTQLAPESLRDLCSAQLCGTWAMTTSLRFLPSGVETIAYADDLALIVTARSESLLQDIANDALDVVDEWMRTHMLKVAPEKSEAIFLIGRKRSV